MGLSPCASGAEKGGKRYAEHIMLGKKVLSFLKHVQEGVVHEGYGTCKLGRKPLMNGVEMQAK